MSDWLVLTIAMASSVAVVVLIALLRNRRAGDDDDPSETPDVIEYMTMMISVVYAIILGLAIAGVWEERGTAQETVRAEAFALYELRERAADLPAGTADGIRADITTYADYATGEEWPVMADADGLTPRGDRLLADVRRAVLDYEPQTEKENNARYALADQIAAATEARNTRALDAGPTLGSLVWFVLVAGAVVSVGMLFALQIQRSKRELVLAGLFSALIAFLLFLVWYFDFPFARGIDDIAEPFSPLLPAAEG